MIFQAQSRLAFGIQGRDADILAQEFASISYDSHKIKDEIYSRKQLVQRHKKITLSSWSEASQEADSWQKKYGRNWSENSNEVKAPNVIEPTTGKGKGTGRQESQSEGGSQSHTTTHGGHETLIPEYEEFAELSSRTYESFDEQASAWAQKLRNLVTGQAVAETG